MNALNAGAAIQQGNQIASSEQNMQNNAQVMQQRNALAPSRLAQAELRTDSDRTAYMKQQVSTTVDQATWDAVGQDLMSKGFPKEQWYPKFDPELKAQIIGKPTGKEAGFTLKAGQTRFSAKGEQIASVPVGEDGGMFEVQSSQFLPGGGARIVSKTGQIKVVQPTDEELTLIKNSEERGVDLQQKRAQGRELGKDAAQIASKAFERTGKLRSNVLTLRKVIDASQGGAVTGPLVAKMPSFRAESVRLEALRNQLGLDVVGSVTFGALSEGELNLALNTALPTNLKGPELVKWAQEKIDAQEKLAGYLEDQAVFLSQRGNTAADWLQKTRSVKNNQQGGQQQAPQIQEGATATNPQTGQTITFRGGQWQ